MLVDIGQVGQPREHHVATWQRLTRLAHLSNIDKHRRLQLPWWAVKDAWASSLDEHPSIDFHIAPGPWFDGQEAISVHGKDAGGEKVSLHANLTVVLPGEVSMGGSAASALENICFFVERAVEVLSQKSGT